jgi:TonB-linked SusC/RagA family outer membrane protein
MKKNELVDEWDFSYLTKTFRIMRITLFFILAALLQTFANEAYSQKTKLSLDYTNTRLEVVLDDIENLSEFYFLANEKLVDVDRRVNLSVKNKKINEILDMLFAGTDVVYTITDRKIILAPSFLSENIQQQQRAVSGKVTDSGGQPLPGVTVVEKGTTRGTVTNPNGEYSLSGISDDATLVFSFVGMKTQEIPIEGRTTVTVVMEEETFGIEEVVAIGYGTAKKRDLTGAISSISSEEILSMPTSNSSQLLQGRASGVIVTSESGSPGAGMNVRIRGLSTINDNNPLYVIDGVPSNSMNDLNPGDIQSIEVLKDASASAIYGSRAANGVVLITTKKGELGLPKITFNSYVGVSSPWKDPDPLGAQDYYDMVKLAHQNGGTTMPINLESEFRKGNDTDWWDEITRNGLTQNYFLSVSGGSERLRYALSGGYFKEEGITQQTAYERYSFRSNFDFDISDKINAGFNLGVTNALRDRIGEAGRWSMGTIGHVFIVDPLVPVINPDADIGDPDYEFNKYDMSNITDAENPVALINRTFDNSKSLSLRGNAFLDYEIYSGLVYRMNLGIDISNVNRYRFSPRYYLTARKNNPNSRVTRNFDEMQAVIFENTLTYTKSFNEIHAFNALLGITAEEYTDGGFQASKDETLFNDYFLRVLAAASSNAQANGNKNENSLLSVIGRVNYNYRDKYLFTGTIRHDGSSRFSSENSWGTFPSVSVGWRISEENFFRILNIGFLDQMKLRAGWGQIGNQKIPNNAYLSLISGGNSRRYPIGGEILQGYSPANIGNPDIQWETVEQTNIALDLNMFKNSLSVSADYFIKDTKNMLLSIPLPFFSGYPSNPWSNAGSVRNKGFELELTHRNKISDFNYTIQMNFSTMSNEVIDLGNSGALFGGVSRVGNITKTEVGHPIGSFFGFVMDGIFQNEAEVNSGNQPLAQPGDVRFKDIAGEPDSNGNPTGPDGIINDYDKTYIGSPLPDYLVGANIGLQYRNIDLTLFLQGSIGNDVYNFSKFFSHAPAGSYNASQQAYNNAWKGEGTSNYQPRISSTNANDNFRNSSFYVEDGSYLRIKNIQLGYSFSSNFCKSINLSSLRIFVSAKNLLTFTNYSGLDPEIGSSTLLDYGIDYNTYPISRTIMVGVNLNF